MSEQEMIHKCCYENTKAYRIVYGTLGQVSTIEKQSNGIERSIDDITSAADRLVYDDKGKPSLQIIYKQSLEFHVCIDHLFSKRQYIHDPSQSYRPYLEDILEMECLVCHRDVTITCGCKRCYSNTHVLVVCTLCGMTTDDPTEHIAAHQSSIKKIPTTTREIAKYFRRNFFE